MIKPLKIGPSTEVAFSRDGALLATLGRYVWVWDLARRRKIVRAHPFPHPSHFDFSPDNSGLAVKSTSGRIGIISAQSEETVVDFNNRKDGEGSNLLYSFCGEYLVDGTWNGCLSVRRASSGKREFLQEFPGEMIKRIHTYDNGNRWIVEHSPKTTGYDPPPPDYFSIWKWPFRTGRYELFAERIPYVDSSALSADGRFLAVVERTGTPTLSVFDAAGSVRAGSIPLEEGRCLRWSPDGRCIGIAQLHASKIVFYEYPSFSKLHEFSLPYASDVGFSPTGDVVALGSWEAGWLLPIGALATPNISLERTARKRAAAQLGR